MSDNPSRGASWTPAPAFLWTALEGLSADATFTDRDVREAIAKSSTSPALALDDSTIARHAPTPALPPLPRIDIRRDGGEDAELELGEPLGEGGMGVVCAARQRSLERDVAVKMLRADRDGPELRAALLREGRITGQLEHPNVVPIHLLGTEEEGAPLVVMKRIDGVTWDAIIGDPDHAFWPRSEAGPDAQVARHLEILVQVCRAIEFAHSHGVVHRDIKPSNVMVGLYGEVYLVDWGIALRLDERVPLDIDDRSTIHFEGTPSYMSPEMSTGDESLIDERTDVYLLGATLYHILTGRRPNDASRGLNAVIVALMERPCLDPSAHRGDLHPELVALVRRATASEPEARYGSVADFREAVSAYVRHRGSLLATDRADKMARGLTDWLAEERTDETWRRGLLTRFSAAQLGYHTALDGWSGNQRARGGLEACTERMLERALATSDATFAETLLAQLSEPSDALRERVDRVREKRRGEREAKVELDRIHAEADFSGGKGARNFIAGGILAIASTFWLLELTGVVERSLARLTALSGAILAFSLLAYAIVTRRAQVSRVNRDFFFVFANALAAMTVNRIFSLIDGTSLAVTLARDLIIEGFICITFVFALGRWLGWGGVAFLAAALGALFLPEYARSFYLAAQFGVPIYAVAYVTRVGTAAVEAPSR